MFRLLSALGNSKPKQKEEAVGWWGGVVLQVSYYDWFKSELSRESHLLTLSLTCLTQLLGGWHREKNHLYCLELLGGKAWL